MRKSLILAALTLSGVLAAAQGVQPHLEPNAQSPEGAPPTIVFTLKFPGAIPPFYNVAVESTGRAEYKSTPDPKSEGDPYELKFTASQATTARLFELARQLNFFQGNYDYTKTKIAFTGTKTLTFKNAGEEHVTNYNWSQNLQIQEITTIFQQIENTIELGRQLQERYRFDKLGVNDILTVMEQEAKENHLAELQVLQPLLTRMARDTSLMNISRRRAEFLLSSIPPNAAVEPAESGQPFR